MPYGALRYRKGVRAKRKIRAYRGGVMDDDVYGPSLRRLRPLLSDPAVAPDQAAFATLRELRAGITIGGFIAYEKRGWGVVLVDVRPEAEATLSYIPRALRQEYMWWEGRLDALRAAVDAYDPKRELLVLVAMGDMSVAYRMDRLIGGLEPLAPLLVVDDRPVAESVRFAAEAAQSIQSGRVADARRRHALDQLQAAAADPACPADRALDLAVDALRTELALIARHAVGPQGRGAVLVDVRPDADEHERFMYLPWALLDDPTEGAGPFAPLAAVIDTYDPSAKFLVVVATGWMMRFYLLDADGGGEVAAFAMVTQTYDGDKGGDDDA